MGELIVDRVRSSTDFVEFVQLPRRLYASEPSYTAPLDREQQSLLHPRHGSFFKHGYASFWIARKNGVPVGRISAQIDHLASTGKSGDRPGFFGCLDAIDNAEVVAALTEVAVQWLQMQGCQYCVGPYMLSINGQSGLLIESQEREPMIGMPWHPKYLRHLVEACGFRIEKVLQSFQRPVEASSFRFLAKRNVREDIKVRALRKNHLAEEVEVFRVLFNEAWSKNWGFVPLSQADIIAFTRDLKPFLIPECAAIAEFDGRPIAFLLVVPNLFDATRGLGSDPSVLGWLRLFSRVKRFRYKSVRVILLGVDPAYPASIRAAALMAVFLQVVERIELYGGIFTVEAGWVLEDNHPMKRILELLHFTPIRTYHLYRKELAAAASGTANRSGPFK